MLSVDWRFVGTASDPWRRGESVLVKAKYICGTEDPEVLEHWAAQILEWRKETENG